MPVDIENCFLVTNLCVLARMKLMKQIIATINKVETQKNPRPPTYVDPNKTIVASYSQGNELAFGQNAGQQCVAMSLGSLIYNDT